VELDAPSRSLYNADGAAGSNGSAGTDAGAAGKDGGTDAATEAGGDTAATDAAGDAANVSGSRPYFTPMTCRQTGSHPFCALSVQKTVWPPGEFAALPSMENRC
jgi:hypothetical protein